MYSFTNFGKRLHLVHTNSYIKRKMCTKPRKLLVSVLSDKVHDGIESGAMTPKVHPGRGKIAAESMPDELLESITIVTKDTPIKNILKDGRTLFRYLRARCLPPTKDDIIRKADKCAEEIQNKMKIDISQLNEEQKELQERKLNKKLVYKLKQRVYDWQPINYNHYLSLQYLYTRFAPEYAVLVRVFYEIAKRCPDFQPHSLFDFGSGVGTVTWAARKFWESSLQEYYCVDVSEDMNELSKLLLQKGDPDAQLPIPNVFYRQFIPSVVRSKYSLVVSSYSFFELPSVNSRLETLMRLWNKVEDFLIIIEPGTKEGFKVINEARDFIISSERSKNSEVHIFSPCPHEYACPKFENSRHPCSFIAPYTIPAIGRKTTIEIEKYCYVVLRKGKRPADDEQWPRVIRPITKRKRVAFARVCTKDGELKEVSYTKKKQGITEYQCARSCKLGDRLPVIIREIDDDFDEVVDSEVRDYNYEDDFSDEDTDSESD